MLLCCLQLLWTLLLIVLNLKVIWQWNVLNFVFLLLISIFNNLQAFLNVLSEGTAQVLDRILGTKIFLPPILVCSCQIYFLLPQAISLISSLLCRAKAKLGLICFHSFDYWTFICISSPDRRPWIILLEILKYVRSLIRVGRGWGIIANIFLDVLNLLDQIEFVLLCELIKIYFFANFFVIRYLFYHILFFFQFVFVYLILLRDILLHFLRLLIFIGFIFSRWIFRVVCGLIYWIFHIMTNILNEIANAESCLRRLHFISSSSCWIKIINRLISNFLHTNAQFSNHRRYLALLIDLLQIIIIAILWYFLRTVQSQFRVQWS